MNYAFHVIIINRSIFFGWVSVFWHCEWNGVEFVCQEALLYGRMMVSDNHPEGF